MSHVFISYKSDEREKYALPIRDALRSWGYDTWIDVDALKPGDDWIEAIDAALKSAYAVIAIMSPAAMSSYPVTREWYVAITANKFIPLQFERCEDHWLFSGIQHIDFASNPTVALAKLRERLQSPGEVLQNDTFRPYLETLFDTINNTLTARLIATLRDDQNAPEPIRLKNKSKPNAVINKLELFDPMFVTANLEKSQSFDTFEQAFRHYQGSLLLLGEPGAGKTITLQHFGRDVVLRRLRNPSEPLPILRSIATWDPYSQSSLIDWLTSAYHLPVDTKSIIESGRAVILLDGLDELDNECPIDPREPKGEKFDPRSRFIEKLYELTGIEHTAPPQNAHRNQILVTCRIRDYDTIDMKAVLKGAVTLQPLSDAQISNYLKEQPQLLKVVRQDERLHELLSTPLLLSFFAFAYEGMSKEERAELANLNQSGDIRERIFIKYFDERYLHEARKPHAKLTYALQELKEILVRVAARSFSNNNVLNLSAIAAEVSSSNADAFVELTTRLNLLSPRNDDVGSKETYSFVHLMLQDTLVYLYGYPRLKDPDVSVRWKAMDTLGKLRDTRVVEPLITALRDTSYAADGSHIADALEKIGDSAVDPLIAALADPHFLGKEYVARALMKIGDIRAVESLIAALRDPNSSVRGYAAGGLGNIQDIRAVEPLIAALRDPNSSVREYVAEALGNIGDINAIGPLRSIGRNDGYVYWYAILARGKLGDGTVLDPLIYSLWSPDSNLRAEASKVLGRPGNTQAVKPLIRLLRDPKGHVRSAANNALRRIGTEEALAAISPESLEAIEAQMAKEKQEEEEWRYGL